MTTGLVSAKIALRTLSAGLAPLFWCCQPLHGGVDPLDGGELSASVIRTVPSSPDRPEERQIQKDRIQRLGGGDTASGSTLRRFAGVTTSSDF